MALNQSRSDFDRTDQISHFHTGPLFSHNFGFDVLHKNLFSPFIPAPIRTSYLQPWSLQYGRTSDLSEIQDSQVGYKVNLDVQQFNPDEINVKMVNNHVVVEGKHEERQDDQGYISRQFKRRYILPDNVNAEALVSKLSSDGVLSIEAPMKSVGPPSKECVIQVIQTNVPFATSAPLSAVKQESVHKDSAK